MFTDVLRGVASQVFIPLTAGGAVRGLGDFDRLLKHGADKVSVNSGAIDNPRIIEEGARRYGSQSVVLSMDVKRVDGQFCVFARGGRENTEIDALEWAKMGEAGGAGELVINSMDADGDRRGFDLELLAEISARVSIPIVASGGAGRMEHFADLFALPGIEAGLAASIFHYRDISIGGLKAFLAQKGVPMRITQ
jgi:cyclase